MSYKSWSIEALELHIRELQEVVREKRGQITRSQLSEMLSLDSQNFLGSGMSYQEFSAAEEIQRILRSYERQSNEERQRRLSYVIRLAIEYEKIVAQTTFSTAFAKSAIAAVFNGNWVDVKGSVDMLIFSGENEELVKVYQPIFANFVSILREALDTVPKLPSEIPSFKD